MPSMSDAPLWIFGYGSLVWRPAFAHVERSCGFVRGYRRRFWQGSTDHRGVPGAPGRVVTLLPGSHDERCWGSAYRIAPEHAHEVLAKLDHREQGGYERHRVEVVRVDAPSVEALVYLATPANPNWLGDAPLEQIAAQVRSACGPSGSNVEYVLELAAALAGIQAEADTADEADMDEHVEQLAALLRSPAGSDLV